MDNELKKIDVKLRGVDAYTEAKPLAARFDTKKIDPFMQGVKVPPEPLPLPKTRKMDIRLRGV